MEYNHKTIEKKWQNYWKHNKTFKAEIDPKKPKYYVLDMFPYPSGAGLHVGHVEGYTATDIIARYKRQKGFNVLHPMGWDSFGLPAEQYAIRTGTHPALTTQTNIQNFKKQLESLGFSYDWDRELATSDPSYYKWTQWIFTKLYEKGLAYEAEAIVNYCPALGTVLANEEVEEGKSKEGGFPIERRPLRQWILKITEYAERLLSDLETLDWPDGLKKLQMNWIGKSMGASLSFPIQEKKERIDVFTTRPDTLFGATCLILAPEHALVPLLTTPEQFQAVTQYQKETASLSDLFRTELNTKKTGVFTGSYAINPINQQPIPIWIADYVLANYGTGGIMVVPAHDERDFSFASTFHIPIQPVILPSEGSNATIEQVKQGKMCWTGPGFYVNSENQEISLHQLSMEEAKQTVTSWLENKGFGKSTTCYKLRDWLFSRQRYWGEPFPILHLENGEKRVLGVDELPLTPPEMDDFKPTGDGKSPLAKCSYWMEITDPKTGLKAWRESNTMPQWAGSCWYYLRFCDPHNQQEAWSKEAERYWLPVDLYIGGVEHAVLHLLYARFWHKVLYDCGDVSTPEPFQSLRNQGIIVSRSFQTHQGNYLHAEDVFEKEGAFYEKSTGEQLRSQVEKMSKSKLNGITPDDIIEELGADSLRLYEMFMGPLEKEKIWNSAAVHGCHRFLSRFFEMATSEKVSHEFSLEACRLGHRLLAGVQRDLELLQFNTAIAKMMEFINEFTRLPYYPIEIVKIATQLLMPFAPHIAEEIWEHLGCSSSLSYEPLPDVNPEYLYNDTVLYIVQINGKLRGKFPLPKDISESALLEEAVHHPNIAKMIHGKTIERVIFVPNKLLNIVLSG